MVRLPLENTLMDLHRWRAPVCLLTGTSGGVRNQYLLLKSAISSGNIQSFSQAHYVGRDIADLLIAQRIVRHCLVRYTEPDRD